MHVLKQAGKITDTEFSTIHAFRITITHSSSRNLISLKSLKAQSEYISTVIMGAESSLRKGQKKEKQIEEARNDEGRPGRTFSKQSGKSRWKTAETCALNCLNT